MKRRHQGHTKWLNEHLGPLRRYLDSQVGRPWDKVFSEICAHIDRSSAVQDHVRDHVAGMLPLTSSRLTACRAARRAVSTAGPSASTGAFTGAPLVRLPAHRAF